MGIVNVFLFLLILSPVVPLGVLQWRTPGGRR